MLFLGGKCSALPVIPRQQEEVQDGQVEELTS